MKDEKRQILVDTKHIIILYHAYCTDGYSGAWVAHKKFGKNASYIPVKRGESLPEGLQGKEVYVIDFSFSKEEIAFAESVAQKFVVIDHHHSSEDDVTSAKEYVFDKEFSGGYLAYRYFFPEKEVPLFLQYISEGDTYLLRLKDYEKYMPIVYARDATFENFDELERLFEIEEGRRHLETLSKIIAEYKGKLLRPIVDSIHFVSFEGVIMPAVNATLPIDERSEALHLIYEKYPPVALMYRYDAGEWKCSLRSNGTFDCTVIATKYGGGGHKESAGFALPGDMPLPFAKLAETSPWF
jgi:nanoRNase/pAp phosphatase (c-di-AMP/oligoRNAs hydrolase)